MAFGFETRKSERHREHS